MKKQEKGRTRIKPISRMLWFAFPTLALPFFAFAEINTPFHHRALAGISEDMGSNVTLALSVEFPTAGAAYSVSNKRPVFTDDMLKEEYLGYFDSNKCYQYVADSSDPTGSQAFANSGYQQNAGMDNAYWFRPANKWNTNIDFKYISNAKDYFEPVGWAENPKNTGGYVGVCNGANEFSGNFMNWLTMSAIDIFRQTLTGGNRALGVNTDPSNYEAGDTVDKTFVRRANVYRGQNEKYSMYKSINLTPENLKKVLPHEYALSNGTVLKEGGVVKNNTFFLYGGYTDTLSLKSNELFVRNNGFGVDIRRVINAGNVNFFAPISNRIMPYQVNVMVCKEGYSEENCAKQANGKYKPEGLMQKKAQSMRFSTLGYANVNGDGINGGVLRSKMNYIVKPNDTTLKYLEEINPTTGQFYVDPDSTESSPNSGSINYLNKFGDLSGYKDSDHVGELYYTALRYLRKKGFPSEYIPFTRKNGTGGNIPTSLTDSEKDNFPIIMDWDNPLEATIDSTNPTADPANVCRNNFLILIGDTFTAGDRKVPGGWSGSVNDSEINVKEWVQKIIDSEKAAGTAGFDGVTVDTTWGEPMAAEKAPATLAALAYWAAVNPLQEKYNKKLKTFTIDVAQDNQFRTGVGTSGNVYYLAAKYGGLDESVSESNKNQIPDLPDEWTRSYDTIEEFEDVGKKTPKTFSVANNPRAMKKALTNAFNGSTTSDKPSSTGTASTSSGKEIKKGDSITLLQSAYRDTSSTDEDGNPIRIFSGDVLAFTTTFTDKGVDRVQIWSADEKLNTAYHYENTKKPYPNGGWTKRKVYTRTSPDGDVIPFNMDNASILSSSLGVSDTYAKSLIAYTLGDSSNEGSDKAFRLRQGHLMGTVIYSTVIPVDKVDVEETTVNTPKGSCTYPASANATTRDERYVVAANDGMTYILDKDGNEVASYLPSKALPKLADYAKHDYEHFFLNDGRGAHKEICLSAKASDDTTNIAVDGARSIVVGSMGRGGNAVYAIDVTQPTPNMLWEFADPALGMSLRSPIITYDKTGAPIVIVSGGYNPEAGDEGYIFVLRLDKPANKPWKEEVYNNNEDEPWRKGGNWYKVKLGKAGVGDLFGYNANKSAYDTQAVYVGDLEGYLWKIAQNDKGRFVVAYDGAPIFQADAPIAGRPYVETIYPNPPRIIFATGRYFDSSDLPTTTSPVQNYAYGLYEGSIAADAKPQANGAMIANSSLLQQEFNPTPNVETYVNAAKETVSTNYYSTTDYSIDTNIHKGWRLKFPENWLSVDNSVMDNTGQLARFSAMNPLDKSAKKDICALSSGSTYMINVNVHTGGTYTSQALYDTNNDGKIDKNDTIYASSTVSDAAMPYLLDGNYVSVGGMTIYNAVDPDGGTPNPGVAELEKKFTVRRLSWREIF